MGPGRPNPFTGATTLSFALHQPSDVIDAFHIRGAACAAWPAPVWAPVRTRSRGTGAMRLAGRSWWESTSWRCAAAMPRRGSG